MPDEIPGLEWKDDPVPPMSAKEKQARSIEDLLNISPELDFAYEQAEKEKLKVKQEKQISPDTGNQTEMKELMELFNTTEDEELKTILKNEIFSITTGTESTDPATVKKGAK